MLVLGLESSCDDCSAAVVEETRPKGPEGLACAEREASERTRGSGPGDAGACARPKGSEGLACAEREAGERTRGSGPGGAGACARPKGPEGPACAEREAGERTRGSGPGGAGGPRILSFVRESQDALHAPYGGVVPELAAREHLLSLRRVIGAALHQAGVGAADIGRVAVTRGPGLIGCLLTTFSAAKAIAWSLGVPFVGVHHALGHMNAARFGSPALPFPALALLVSGGHTHLYLAEGWTEMRLLMKTRDDAAGEAFDKTARMLGLGYPGGAIVDGCAQGYLGGAGAPMPAFTPPRFRDGAPSWSFSGLKTAVKRLVEGADGVPGLAGAGPGDARVGQLCLAVNRTIASWLLRPLPDMVDAHRARSLIVSGGVACNSELRAGAAALAKKLGIALAIPEPRLCTDNGAMVAAAGALLLPSQDPWSENADADLPLAAPEAHVP